MPEKTAEKKTSFWQDTYTICPHCYEKMEGVNLFDSVDSRAGYIQRRYYGFCEKCKVGFEVWQFQERKDDRWFIHKYRAVSRIIIKGKPTISKQWCYIKPLPCEPLVMLGPGGDYDQPIDFIPTSKPLMIQAAKNAKQLFETLKKALGKDGDEL